jgi:hypothetical protein
MKLSSVAFFAALLLVSCASCDKMLGALKSTSGITYPANWPTPDLVLPPGSTIEACETEGTGASDMEQWLIYCKCPGTAEYCMGFIGDKLAAKRWALSSSGTNTRAYRAPDNSFDVSIDTYGGSNTDDKGNLLTSIGLKVKKRAR